MEKNKRRCLEVMILLVFIVSLLCGCGKGENKTTEQIHKLSYQIEEDWLTKADYSDGSRGYGYGDYEININFIEIKDKELMQEEVNRYILDKYPFHSIDIFENGEQYPFMDGKAYQSSADIELSDNLVFSNPGSEDIMISYYATGIESEDGFYILITQSSKKNSDMIEYIHEELLSSLEFKDKAVGSMYKKDIAVAFGYEFSFKDWYTCMDLGEHGIVYEANGDSIYVSEVACHVKPDGVTEKVLAQMVSDTWGKSNRDIEDVTIKSFDEVTCKNLINSAIIADLDIAYHNGSNSASALFIRDESGTFVLCMIDPFGEFDFTDVIDTIEKE